MGIITAFGPNCVCQVWSFGWQNGDCVSQTSWFGQRLVVIANMGAWGPFFPIAKVNTFWCPLIFVEIFSKKWNSWIEAGKRWNCTWNEINFFHFFPVLLPCPSGTGGWACITFLWRTRSKLNDGERDFLERSETLGRMSLHESKQIPSP